jgi:DNA (cytosine-5)-methyltransferase 1
MTGGFALGAYWAGMRFENHYFSEVDPYCVELYKLRFPDAIALGDITKHGDWRLADGDYIITGGFPCQDISVAGKGTGIKGERSGLWFKMWSVISKVRPRFAIMENVGALTFRGLTDVLGSLAEIGYDAEWQDIRAEDVGAPHRRERIWIVAYPDGYSKSISAINETEISRKLGEISYCKSYDDEGSQEGRGAQKQFRNIHRGVRGFRGWGNEPKLDRVVDGVSDEMDRNKALGNSIVPQIAELLFRQINTVIQRGK